MRPSPPPDARGDAVDQALARLERQGDRALVRALIDSFLERTPQRLAAADGAHRQGDLGEAARLVHMLCSSCLNLGAESMAAVCRTAEDHARAGRGDPFQACLATLLASFEELRPRLQATLGNGEEGSR